MEDNEAEAKIARTRCYGLWGFYRTKILQERNDVNLRRCRNVYLWYQAHLSIGIGQPVEYWACVSFRLAHKSWMNETSKQSILISMPLLQFTYLMQFCHVNIEHNYLSFFYVSFTSSWLVHWSIQLGIFLVSAPNDRGSPFTFDSQVPYSLSLTSHSCRCDSFIDHFICPIRLPGKCMVHKYDPHSPFCYEYPSTLGTSPGETLCS